MKQISPFAIVLCMSILLSCEEHKSTSGKPFEILSDEVICGAQMRFRFNVAADDNWKYEEEPCFAGVTILSSEDDGCKRDTVVRLDKDMCGIIEIPLDAAALMVELSTKTEVSDGYGSGVIMVYDEHLRPVRKSRSYFLFFSQMDEDGEDTDKKKTVRTMIDEERRQYPDELSIFACKWVYELKNGLMDSTSISKDMEEIRSCDKSVNQAGWYYMASLLYTIVHDNKGNKGEDLQRSTRSVSMSEITKASRQHKLPEELTCAKNHPLFNDVIFVNLLLMFRSSEYVMTTSWLAEVVPAISNNPTSLYAEFLMMGGIYNLLEPKMALRVASELARGSRKLVYRLNLAEILCRAFPDSTQTSKKLIDELKSAQRNNTYYQDNRDPLHSFHAKRFVPSILDADISIRDKSNRSALAILDSARAMCDDPWSIFHGMILTKISECYYEMGLMDSSTYSMVAALQYAPWQKFISDTLHARWKNEKSNRAYTLWLRQMQSEISTSFHARVPENLKKIECEDGSIVDVDKLKDSTLVIECWSRGCSFCTKNLVSIDDYRNVRSKRATRFIVATKDKTELYKTLSEKRLTFSLAKASVRILKAFSVNSYPSTIVIRNGRVIGKYSGLLKIADVLESDM